MPETLEVGDLTFEVRRSDKRKTISIVVDRGGQLVITAPYGYARESLLSAVESKKLWIYTRLMGKEGQIAQTPPLKEYLSGEGFFYLGKSYRLLLIDPDPGQARTPPLRFAQGRFHLRRDERYHAREHFIKWYTMQTRAWIEPRLPGLAQRIGVQAPPLAIMDLGYHWASCSPANLSFHWRTIMLPPHVIEYLIVHELAHLLEPNHAPAFWDRVERIVPDWQVCKEWLAENGGRYGV